MNLRYIAPCFLLACSLTEASPFVPPPACAAGTLASYLLLGPGGCSIGPELGYFDFSFNVISAGGGITPLAAADITVTPSLIGLNGSLVFSAAFSAVGPESVIYEIAYNIDPHPIILSFDSEMFAFSPVAPGYAEVATDLCIGAPFTPACAGVPASLLVFHDGIVPMLMDGTGNFAPIADLGVRHTITLAGNAASSDFSAFGGVTGVVPEPGTWFLIAAGLAGLAIRRRKLF